MSVCFVGPWLKVDPSHGAANVVNGKYKFTEDLLELQKLTPRISGSFQFGPNGGSGSPLFKSLNLWRLKLESHPDREFARYIEEGILQGFRIGFDHEGSPLRGAISNLLSVARNPVAVQQYIDEELRQGRLIGPLPPDEAAVVHRSPIGIIPKQHKPGKWRLIHDLSSPEGASINDGVSEVLSSLSYVTVEQVAWDIVKLGPGSLLAKLDIWSA